MKNKRDLLNRVEINPQVMVGKPVIKGTRIPVALIMQLLKENWTREQIKSEYPRATDEDIDACIEFAQQRKAFIKKANKQYALIKANPKEWKELLDEQKEWDSTLMDGLESD